MPPAAAGQGPTGMSGGASGTNGGRSGTNGAIPFRLWLIGVAIVGAVILVNISSDLIENPPGHRRFAEWEPYCWEISSWVAFAVLLPGVYWAYRRFHWGRLTMTQFLAGQALGWLYYTLGHDAIMVGIRHLVYQSMGQNYDFSHGNLFLEMVYEGRKDVLTCALMGAIFWVDERLKQPATVEPPPTRIEVKCDGRTLYVTPAEILYAEAAGNYVELHLVAPAKPLLLRGTLAGYEKRLSEHGLVRVHRSRLLNLAHMRAFSVTSSGDLRITLDDGREVVGSRRYRDGLDTTGTP